MPFHRTLIVVFLLLATACSRAPDVETSASTEAMEAPAPAVQRKPQAEIDWSPVRLEAGDAWVDCGADYRQGDGRPVLSLAYIDLRGAMQDCRSTGLLRLRYKGRMTASFAALLQPKHDTGSRGGDCWDLRGGRGGGDGCFAACGEQDREDQCQVEDELSAFHLQIPFHTNDFRAR